MSEVVFEYDSNKSESNKYKHGIDFVQAQQLWRDRNAIVFPVFHPVEERHILLAVLQGKVWTAVFTLRGQVTRVISVRRARNNEERHYHENQ